MQRVGPAPRSDPAYILQLASAVAELQRRAVALITTIADNYVANTPGEVILADATGGAISVSLPFAKGFYGQVLSVKKTDASTNDVMLEAQTSELIDGSASRSIEAQYGGFTVISDGEGWHIIGGVV